MVKLIFFIIFFLTNSIFAETLTKQEKIYFNFIDLNNDNHISMDEFLQSVEILFKLVDQNLDGKLSENEIIEIKNIIESLS